MPLQKLKKIESLISQIDKLSQEHARLKDSLSQELTTLLNQKNALHYDFETLVGGILFVIDTLKKDDHEALKKQQNWKIGGAGYFKSDKKRKASSNINVPSPHTLNS